jgi:hypothetical protein
VGRSARVVDHTSMLHHVIHSQPQAADDGRSELVRGCLQHAFQACGGLGSLQVMTVCDIGCASSVVCAERFRTVAKSFTAGAHSRRSAGPWAFGHSLAEVRRSVIRRAGPAPLGPED